MKKWQKLLMLASLTLGFTACNQTTQTSSSESTTASTEEFLIEEVQWPLYTITDEAGNHSYLLGSIHVGEEEMYPFPTEITEAVTTSDVVISEINFESMNTPTAAALSQRAIVKEPHVLTDLSKKDKERLAEKLDSYNLSLNNIEGMNYFGLTTMLQSKYSGIQEVNNGVDMQIAKLVSKNGIENIGFETIGQQYDIINQYYDDYLTTADDWIGELPDLKTAKSELQELLQYYCEGKIADNFDELFLEEEEDNDIMLAGRNHDWLQQLKTLLPEEKQYFIVVGAGHLYGEEGLIALLQAENYQVEQVEFE
ncbi:uncharacterized protein YbaP (TraB family) [Enterococcus sp. PF1-24]|uniref:TraB/GumN family protein n=1 Tax=unclassified Enterococcus TaxID=2608891 RepID=UPI002473EF9E|nr:MULTISPECIES: TraB/GumN family protein [unclassified Enterococcus]MDH6364144.1 uncharacterized protein YbaP (TraB family) [Enterococcus sp. PFB1-1]MDH6401245.1 uncharacterized protein YbaP (TraB family) [Enterococcus sp. PF1-24]